MSWVSARLASLAAEAAEELKAARLALAQSTKGGGGPEAARAPQRTSAARSVTAAPTGDRALRSPGREKRRAATQAVGARRQAKRDSR